VGGPRKHQRVTVTRAREYFGFQLDSDMQMLEGRFPPEHRGAALDALAEALLDGETIHPDQARVRRAVETLDELWRRSGGALTNIDRPSLAANLRGQLGREGVESWETFIRSKLSLDPAALVDDGVRERLLALPDSMRVKGDMVPLDYLVHDGRGIAQVTLREGQARRLRNGDLAPIDRPLRFAVRRGNHPATVADTLDDLRDALDRLPRQERSPDRDEPPRGRHRQRHQGKGRGRKGPGRRR
jgi:hypothetical protein